MTDYDVVVVGGCIQDFFSYTTRFPKPGESIRGKKFGYGCGGKGANQAVMAGRLGAKAAFIGKVGDDMFGRETATNFQSNGVNTDHLTIAPGEQTGAATITVDDSGQNCIVMCLGANTSLRPNDVHNASSIISKAKVLLCQLEVMPEVTLEALRLAKKLGVTTIFNTAPAPPDGLSEPDYFLCADILCANENEAEMLTGLPLTSEKDVEPILHALKKRGTAVPMVTLGENGCAFLCPKSKSVEFVPAPKVKAVDTTGAGDAFVGTLAYFTALRGDMPLKERVRRACEVATISVQSPGTQLSYPKRSALPAELFQ